MANRLFSDYIIQSAGKVTFSVVDNRIVVSCSGGSKVLNLKPRSIDALIIQDELDASFDDE